MGAGDMETLAYCCGESGYTAEVDANAAYVIESCFGATMSNMPGAYAVLYEGESL
jgi:hypothetical protein